MASDMSPLTCVRHFMVDLEEEKEKQQYFITSYYYDYSIVATNKTLATRHRCRNQGTQLKPSHTDVLQLCRCITLQRTLVHVQKTHLFPNGILYVLFKQAAIVCREHRLDSSCSSHR